MSGLTGKRVYDGRGGKSYMAEALERAVKLAIAAAGIWQFPCCARRSVES